MKWNELQQYLEEQENEVAYETEEEMTAGTTLITGKWLDAPESKGIVCCRGNYYAVDARNYAYQSTGGVSREFAIVQPYTDITGQKKYRRVYAPASANYSESFLNTLGLLGIKTQDTSRISYDSYNYLKNNLFNDSGSYSNSNRMMTIANRFEDGWKLAVSDTLINGIVGWLVGASKLVYGLFFDEYELGDEINVGARYPSYWGIQSLAEQTGKTIPPGLDFSRVTNAFEGQGYNVFEYLIVDHGDWIEISVDGYHVVTDKVVVGVKYSDYSLATNVEYDRHGQVFMTTQYGDWEYDVTITQNSGFATIVVGNHIWTQSLPLDSVQWSSLGSGAILTDPDMSWLDDGYHIEDILDPNFNILEWAEELGLVILWDDDYQEIPHKFYYIPFRYNASRTAEQIRHPEPEHDPDPSVIDNPPIASVIPEKEIVIDNKRIKVYPEIPPEPELKVPDPNPSPDPPKVEVIFPSNNISTVYNPNNQELNRLGDAFWRETFLDKLNKYFTNNPFEAIISYHMIYYKPTIGARDNITLGLYQPEDNNGKIETNIVSKQYTEIDCGYATVNEFFGDARDYAPYTTVQVYLPFIGFRDLSIDDIMGARVYIKYKCDVLTGDCLAEITCFKGGIYQLLYTFEGNCAVQYPLTGADHSRMISSILSAVTSVGAAAITGGLSVATGLAVGGSLMQGQRATISRSGSFSSNAGAMGYKKPMIIVSRPRDANPVFFNNIYGYTSEKFLNLSDCKGYTKVRACHVEYISDATAEEQAEIDNLLKNGVIIN